MLTLTAIYEAEADAFWDKFYDCYNDKFFKDRHYLIKEFPELHEHDSKGGVQLRLRSPTLAPSIESAAPATLSQGPAGTKIVLEVGCGAGNTIIPLLATMKQSIFFGCDFSKSALNVFKVRRIYCRQCYFSCVKLLTWITIITTQHLPESF